MKNIFIVFIYLLLCIGALVGQTIKVRVANYPPQYYKNESGEWTGIDVELIKAVVKEAGMAIEFIEMPWSRALTSIKTGEIDIICNVSKTDERSEFMQWIGPERYTQMVLIVRKEDKGLKIKSLDEMLLAVKKTGKKIAAQQNAYYGDEIKKRIASDTQFEEAFVFIPESSQFLPMLQKGRILGYIEERSNIAYKIKKDLQYADFFVHPFIIHKDPVYFAVTKILPDSDFLKLQRAFSALEKKGTLEMIRKQW